MIDTLRDRLGGLLGADTPEDITEDEGGEWPYQWAETAVENVHGEPVLSHAAPDDPESVFAGPLARQMIEGPRENPDQPLYVGLGTRKGRHVGIERQFLFRHTCVFGVTGYGKSTLLKNTAKQIIESGHGCVFLDPKGQDSVELIQMLPDDRLDDLVWIEPGQSRSAVAGFNFLEVGVGEDDPMYDTAVENVVGDLVRMVGLDDYWGPLMDGVCSNLIRGTTRLDRDFNLLDLYYILTSESARQQYAEMLEEEGLTFLADYAHKIEEMEDDDLDALQRRFKDWVEDPLARSAIAHRNTDIDIESIIDEDKILVVRMAEQREELKEMIGTAILRRVWSAIRSRAATYDTDYDPFFLIADEFDLLATQDSSVTTMLSKARSLSLALFLCCQQPSQLPEQVVDAMYANCDTVLSFSPGSPKDARAVARNLDMDPETLRHESNYHVWTQLTLSATRERSEAFRTYTLPPYPPLRTVPDAMHAIERTVRATGREPLTDEEMRRGLILGDDPDGLPGESDDLQVTDAVERAAAQAVHDTCIREEVDVATREQCAPAVRRRVARLDETPTDTADRLATPDDVWRHVLQHVHDDMLEETGDGFRVPSPRSTLGTVGTDKSAGGKDHADLMWYGYRPLTWAGFDVDIHDASGDDADALARPIPEGDRNAPEFVERLLDGQPEARIEAEHSTGESKPGMTGKHVCQAAQEGRSAIILVDPANVNDVVDTVRHEPRFCRSDSDDGETHYYTGPRKVTIGGDVMTRPGGQNNVWVRDDETGELTLGCSDGIEHATFDSVHEFDEDADAYPAPDGRNVYEPIIPEVLLDGVNTEPTEEIVVVSEGAESLADLEVVVDADGMTVSADAIGADSGDSLVKSEGDGEPLVKPDRLDVPAGTADLLRLIQREADGPVTKGEVVEMADAHDGDLDVDRAERTIYDWVSRLVEANALRSGEYRHNEGREYHVVRNAAEVASQ